MSKTSKMNEERRQEAIHALDLSTGLLHIAASAGSMGDLMHNDKGFMDSLMRLVRTASACYNDVPSRLHRSRHQQPVIVGTSDPV